MRELSSITLGADDTEKPLMSKDEETLPGYFIVVFSPQLGVLQRLEILSSPATFGRRSSQSDASIQLDDHRVSKRHISVEFSGVSWRVTDLESKNGTFLNGARLDGGKTAELTDGSILRVGDSLLVFRSSRPPTNDNALDQFLPGLSPSMEALRRRLRRIAGSSGPALLLGETGTGKEFAAKAFFELSGRTAEPFVPVNCGALRKDLSHAELFGAVRGAFTDAKEARRGIVEQANGGVLFLDEIGDLELGVQVELLRFLEDGTYRAVGGQELKRSSARVVAATNVDLSKSLEAGTFRRDLYARLTADGPPIELPALAERPEDTLVWAQRFVEQMLAPGETKPTWTAGFAECCLLHNWPENLRGLRGAIAAALEERRDQTELLAEHLPAKVQEGRARGRAEVITPVAPTPVLREVNAANLAAALQETAGNVRQSASFFGVSRRSFYRHCEALGVDVESFRLKK